VTPKKKKKKKGNAISGSIFNDCLAEARGENKQKFDRIGTFSEGVKKLASHEVRGKSGKTQQKWGMGARK